MKLLRAKKYLAHCYLECPLFRFWYGGVLPGCGSTFQCADGRQFHSVMSLLGSLLGRFPKASNSGKLLSCLPNLLLSL
jgi:hypothetical protein